MRCRRSPSGSHWSRTRRCAAWEPLCKGFIEEQKKREIDQKGCLERAVSWMLTSRVVLKKTNWSKSRNLPLLGGEIASLAFRGTRTISGPAARRKEGKKTFAGQFGCFLNINISVYYTGALFHPAWLFLNTPFGIGGWRPTILQTAQTATMTGVDELFKVSSLPLPS